MAWVAEMTLLAPSALVKVESGTRYLRLLRSRANWLLRSAGKGW